MPRPEIGIRLRFSPPGQPWSALLCGLELFKISVVCEIVFLKRILQFYLSGFKQWGITNVPEDSKGRLLYCKFLRSSKSMNDKRIVIKVLRWRLDDDDTLFISDWSQLFACSWFLYFRNASLVFSYAPKQRRWCEITNEDDTTKRQSDKFQFSTSISRRFISFYSSKIGSCFSPFNSNNSVIDVVVNTLLSILVLLAEIHRLTCTSVE